MPDLFSELRLGALTVPNRIFMAPLTRCRAGEEHVANALMAEHYAQRASAGLLIAEATMAMEGNSAFWREPGIYGPAQVAGWKLVTDAVHAAGGRIFLNERNWGDDQRHQENHCGFKEQCRCLAFCRTPDDDHFDLYARKPRTKTR